MADPYISEFQTAGDGANFVEVRVDEGYDVSTLRIVYYDPGGESMVTYALGAIDGGGATGDVYVINSGPVNAAAAFALYDTSTGEVIQFLSSGSTVTAINGPASGRTSSNVGTHSSSQSMQSDDGGQTYYTQSSPNPGSAPPPPACFLRGTRIAVPGGSRRIETLRAGDLVETWDGPRSILWISRTEVQFTARNAHQKPVRIVCAEGRHVDLSPHHRVLTALPTGGLALVPARLIHGARQRRGVRRAVYLHLLLDDHSVVAANGLAVETLFNGDMSRAGLPARFARHTARVPAAPLLTARQVRGVPGGVVPLRFAQVARHGEVQGAPM